MYISSMSAIFCLQNRVGIVYKHTDFLLLPGPKNSCEAHTEVYYICVFTAPVMITQEIKTHTHNTEPLVII